MSNSIQLTPSATADTTSPKLSSLDSGTITPAGDDPKGFTAVFASYAESDPDAAKLQIDENLTELLNEMLPQEMLVDGNSLPEGDKTAMWQALMLLQPAENNIVNSPASQKLGMDLLDSQRKPAFSSTLLNQDYFNNLTAQIKEDSAPLPAGFTPNNISMQLAATHFSQEKNDALLLNMDEQLIPLQGTNTTLSQSLSAVGLGTATQAAVTQTQMAPLNLGQNAWESNLGSRLQMLVGQNVQTAEIRLDPPELGALDIKIKITNDIASVNITSPHAQVREALETAVPKLREMFEESGVSLGDVNVGQESFAQQQNSTEEGNGHEEATRISKSEFDDEPAELTRKIVGDNLLDIYA